MSVKAKDTKLQYADVADLASMDSGDWTSVATVKSIKPPARGSKDIDVTHLESDAMEREPGLPDVGECEATIHYDPTQATALAALFGVKKAWRILFPNGGGSRWVGWISEDGEEEIVQDDILRSTIKLTATGDLSRFVAA